MDRLNCIHGIDERFCGRCSNPRLTVPTLRFPNRSRARKVVRSSALEFHFASEGTQLELVALVQAGWRFLRKVYGFSEQIVVSSLVHSDLRAQVQLFPMYGGLVEEAPVLDDASGPPDKTGISISIAELEANRAGGPARVSRPFRRRNPIQFRIKDGAVRLQIEILEANSRFNSQLDWRVTSTGAPYVKWVHDGLVGRLPKGEAVTGESADRLQATVQVECQLQLLLVARPPALRAGSVDREWLERHFVSGGLRSLGKRR